MKKHPGKIILVVATLLLGGSFYWASTAGESANEGVVLSSHIKGNPDATVIVTEYSDFQCPACAEAYVVVKNIMDQYGDSVRFEYKHFPLISIHPFAVPAAKAAEAAGQQGKFFEMHDKLFEKQSEWSTAASPQAFFVKYAEELELDVDVFKRHLRASMIDDRIEEEFNEARGRGLTGTPSFFLNGQRMAFESYEDLRQQIATAAGDVPQGAGEASSTQPITGPAVKFGI